MTDTISGAAGCTYVRYTKEVGIELIHVDEPHDLKYVSHNLHNIVCAEAGEEEDGGS